MDMSNFPLYLKNEVVDIITHETGYVIAGLLGGALLAFWTKLKKLLLIMLLSFKSRFKKTIPAMIQRDMEIYNHLFDIKARTRADRVLVFQFHNGSYYTNSASQMKMSCTHEVVGEGISRESRNMQDLIISQFAGFTTKLIQESFFVLDRENIDTYSMGLMMSNQGVRTAAFALFRYEGVIEGFLAIIYLDDVLMDRRQKDVTVLDDRREDDSEGSLPEIVATAAPRIGYILRKKLY